MIEFEAQDEKQKINLKRTNGTSKIIEVNYIGDKDVAELNRIEARREQLKDEDFEGLFDLAYSQLSLLSSNTTKKDLAGMSIIRIFELVAKMTVVALGTREDGEAKKKVVRKRKRR